MNKTYISKAAMVLSVLALLFSSPVQAKQSSDSLERLKALQTRLAKAAKTSRHSPPAAYQAFCRKHPRECVGGGASKVKYNKALLTTLYATNREVNRQIRYRSDRGDKWSIRTRYGDCEDYALTKRSELIKKGIPASSLRMAVVKTRAGIGHAVLVVKTTRGDLVLDNRRSSIRTTKRTGYKYLKMATANPKKWVSLLR